MSVISAEEIAQFLEEQTDEAAALVRALQAVRVAADHLVYGDSIVPFNARGNLIDGLRAALAAVARIEKGPSNG